MIVHLVVFVDPSPMGLVSLDRFLMVYEPVNAREARSLNSFPLFSVVLQSTL